MDMFIETHVIFVIGHVTACEDRAILSAIETRLVEAFVVLSLVGFTTPPRPPQEPHLKSVYAMDLKFKRISSVP